MIVSMSLYSQFAAASPTCKNLNADPHELTSVMRCVVYIRQKGRRGASVDPAPVYWDQQREERLWKVLQSEKEIDWTSVADKFNVPVVYVLQQAAWLYEKELCLLKTRMNLITLPKEQNAAEQVKSEHKLLSMNRLEESDSESLDSEEGFAI